MDDWTRTTSVTAARQLLLRYKETHPAWADDKIPLDDLVSWLGLQVETFHPGDYPQGTYGFLESGEDLIWLCRTLPSSLRRFTLAHELGHVVLHSHNAHMQQWLQESGADRVGTFTFQSVPELSREDPCQRPDVQEEVTEQSELLQELLGIGQSYNPRSERELTANIFAAELLMPLERVRTLYISEGIAPPNRLASIFEVSNAAMLNRLVGLLTERPALPNGQTTQGERDVDGNQGEDKPLPWAGDNPSPLAESSAGIKTIPKKKYDEFQQAAIEAATPALIVAGPGSGKTSTLIGRTEYLIHTLNVKPAHILALTFSRKAAQEMQERLEQVLHDGSESSESSERSEKPGASGASRDIGIPTVSTFHAFCAEMLRTYGGLVGLRTDFALIDETEGYFLLRQLTREMRLYHYRNLKSPAYYFPDILKAISRAKDELVSPEQYRQLAEQMLAEVVDEESELSARKALEVAAIYALYEEGLRRREDTDFGGLIMLAVQLLQEYPEVCYEQQQRFSHILVDEFQDINRASGVLLRLLAGDEQRVWVVGDANQAIYGFRGASPANIANFRDDYPDAVVLPLSRNYRSRPDIVKFADVFRREHLEYLEPDSVQGTVQTARTTAEDAYVTLAVAPDEASELNGLISDMWRKRAGGYHFRDIVVLCRTRAQARKITQGLVDADLPVIERGGLLEQEHIKNLLSIIMLLAEPSGMGILRAARQSDHLFTQSDIEALLQAAREQRVSPMTLILRDEAPLTMSIDGGRSLRRLSKILKALHLAQNVWSLLADYLFIQTSLMRELLASDEDTQAQAVLDDYAGLLQLARYYDQQQQALRFQKEQEDFARGEDGVPIGLPTIQEQTRGFLDYLSVLLTLRHDGGKRQEEGSDEETPDVIRVMTVHASKGLEFPVVYLPGIVKQRFPMQRRSNPVEPPTGMLPAESDGDAAHETDEACLFYVGATRARDHLVLSYAERYGKKNDKRAAYGHALVAGLPGERS